MNFQTLYVIAKIAFKLTARIIAYFIYIFTATIGFFILLALKSFKTSGWCL